VIERGGRELLGREVLQRTPSAASSMQRALQALDARGVVREDEGRRPHPLPPRRTPSRATWIAEAASGCRLSEALLSIQRKEIRLAG
jgi:hypothetical protein